MPELDAKDRDRLRSTQFAYVDSKGGEHLPIHDEVARAERDRPASSDDFESEAAKERARQKILECRGEARHRGRRRLEHPPGEYSASAGSTKRRPRGG